MAPGRTGTCDLRIRRPEGSLRAERDLEAVGEVEARGASRRVAVPELEVAGVRGLDAGERGVVHVELFDCVT